MDVETPARFEAVPVHTPADGPLAVELVPAPDPWDVARRLAHLGGLLFLDSAERHGERGRYSFVSAKPVQFSGGSVGRSHDLFRSLLVNPAPPRMSLPDELPP